VFSADSLGLTSPRVRALGLAVVVLCATASVAAAAEPVRLPSNIVDYLPPVGGDGTRFLFHAKGSSRERVYDTKTRSQRRVHDDAHLAPDGRHLIYGRCASFTRCSLIREDLKTKHRKVLRGYADVYGFNMASHDARYVFACRDPCENKRLSPLNSGILDTKTRKFLRVFRFRRRHVLWAEALSGDGATAVYSDLINPELYRYSARTRRTQIISRDGEEGGSQFAQVSSDGRFVFFITSKRRYELWSSTSGTTVAMPGRVQDAYMNEDGSDVALACGDSIFLRSTATGSYRLVLSGLSLSTAELEFAGGPREKQLLLSGEGGRVYFKDATGFAYVSTGDATPMGTSVPSLCQG
jgi:hypothetical protein